jgi:hypothetical protein
MKFSTKCRTSRRLCPVRLALTILSLALSNAVVFAQQENNSKPAATSTPMAPQKPTASPKPSPTPDTKIDAKTEAELLQAEDRFINGILNRDAKALEELLHPGYADSINGSERAINKRGTLARVAAGRMPAYRVEKERKLTRSGDVFTVEGLGNDISHELTEDNPTEQWAQVRRIWSREGTRWVATAQIITPLKENEARERLAPETKEKQPD